MRACTWYASKQNTQDRKKEEKGGGREACGIGSHFGVPSSHVPESGHWPHLLHHFSLGKGSWGVSGYEGTSYDPSVKTLLPPLSSG